VYPALEKSYAGTFQSASRGVKWKPSADCVAGMHRRERSPPESYRAILSGPGKRVVARTFDVIARYRQHFFSTRLLAKSGEARERNYERVNDGASCRTRRDRRRRRRRRLSAETRIILPVCANLASQPRYRAALLHRPICVTFITHACKSRETYTIP